MLIESDTLSGAWTHAFLATYDHREISPLVITVSGFSGLPPEDLHVRSAVDALLCAQPGVWRVGTTASTIFPSSMWRRGTSRAALYERYRKVYEKRICKIPANRRGTYFLRLISFGVKEINQLERIIATWNRNVKRRSAFVASFFDPSTDHLPTPFLGFPCMHQVCFVPEAHNGFAVTGFYAKQDIFDSGYGNYLGLARLGEFVADAFDRNLTRITCVSSVAGLSNRFSKGELAGLASELRKE